MSEWTQVPEGRTVKCHHCTRPVRAGESVLEHTFKRASNTVIEHVCVGCIVAMAETIPSTVKVGLIRQRIQETGRFFGHVAA